VPGTSTARPPIGGEWPWGGVAIPLHAIPLHAIGRAPHIPPPHASRARTLARWHYRWHLELHQPASSSTTGLTSLEGRMSSFVSIHAAPSGMDGALW